MTFEIRRRTLLMGAGAALVPMPGRAAIGARGSGRGTIHSLRTNYREAPLGIGGQPLHFSWAIESEAREVVQSAYRLQVASSPELLRAGRSDIWDSGRVVSASTVCVPYGGPPLPSRSRCWWTVEAWDGDGRPFAAQELAPFEIGLLRREDWTAEWLAAENAVSRADRRAAPRWITGGSLPSEGVRWYRRKVKLRSPARRFSFYFDRIPNVTVRSLTVGAQQFAWENDRAAISQWVDGGPLEAGAHWILVAVEERAKKSAPGFTCFLRFELDDGSQPRIATDTSWETRQVATRTPIDAGLPGPWKPVQVEPSLTRKPWPSMPALNMRQKFEVASPVVAARLYATALGCYEAHLNGRRVSDVLLAPEPSQYDRRLLVQCYDVTPLLNPGANVLGLTVADGFYGGDEGRFEFGPPPLAVRAQLEIETADGGRQVVGTGPGWRQHDSEIVSSDDGIGEIHDARRVQPGWSSAAFDDSGWDPVATCSPPEAVLLTPQISPPVRVRRRLAPKGIRRFPTGAIVVDFGENFAGYCRLHVRGSRGAKVTLRFAERLDAEGMLDQKSMGIEYGILGRKLLPKTDSIILSGSPGGEWFEPRFSYRGFRYAEITGLASSADLIGIEGIAIGTDLRVVGDFRTATPLVQQLVRAIERTIDSNAVANFTDNPSREQRGWAADAALIFDTAAFGRDMAAFTARRLDDFTDTQSETGAFELVSPMRIEERVAKAGPTPAWSDGPGIMAFQNWRHYDDHSSIRRHWNALERYQRSILDANPDYRWRHRSSYDWADHLALGEHGPEGPRVTPPELVATAYWAYSASLMAEMASAIGDPAAQAHHRRVYERIRAGFIEDHVRSTGTVGNGSQASSIFALKFDLVPENLRRMVVASLVADIRSHGAALTTGILATQFALDVLADHGEQELAIDLLLKTDFPSWGHMLRSGATTIWETWKGDEQISAQNQPAFGSVGAFLYKRLAGIDAAAPGFAKILSRPLLSPRIPEGRVRHQSVRGPISASWSVSGRVSRYDLTIPANTRGEVHLPAKPERVSIAGVSASRMLRSQGVRRAGDGTVIEVGSGDWSFRVRHYSTS